MIKIASARHASADCVTSLFTGERSHYRTGSAAVDIHLPGIAKIGIIPRCTHDDVVVSVSSDVAGAGN